MQQLFGPAFFLPQLVRSLVDNLLQILGIFLHYRDHVVEYVWFPAKIDATVFLARGTLCTCCTKVLVTQEEENWRFRLNQGPLPGSCICSILFSRRLKPIKLTYDNLGRIASYFTDYIWQHALEWPGWVGPGGWLNTKTVYRRWSVTKVSIKYT